jgi:hypothetical protein
MLIFGVAVTIDPGSINAFSPGVKCTKHNTKRAIDGQAKAITKTGIDFQGRRGLSCHPNAVARHHPGSGDEIRKEQ